MYVPPKFAQSTDEAWRIVTEAGAGLFLVAKDGVMQTVFTPVVVSDDRTTITSHLAKANSWWRDVADGTEVLLVFVAASAYVSPTYYPSKEENPNVVPTWNFVMAEVRGTVTFHHDPSWLLDQVTDVTEHFEAGRSPEWLMPPEGDEYVSQQLKAIVGLEISVTSIEGKAKLSQNRPEIDHDSVRDHLAQGCPNERNVAGWM